ncbi:MAG: fructosamine kinase family protein [Cyclobacteriaceae bacterium]
MSKHIDALFIQLLEEALGVSLTLINRKSLGGGSISQTCKVETSEGVFFVKWNEQGPEDIFLREAESLAELAKAGSNLKIPRVFASAARTKSSPGLLITEFLEPATAPRAELDEQMGRGIAQLHRYHQESYGFYHDNYCGATLQDNSRNKNWVDFFGNQRIGALLDKISGKRVMSKDERKTYDQFLDSLPKLIGHAPAASLNHGDLWSGNYLHSSAGPALVDPASYYADREFDLAMMGMFGGFSDRVWQAYEEAYPLPPEWKERHELYKLYHYLNHYYLFGGSYGQQALSIARSYL